jgi:hypothetical protein
VPAHIIDPLDVLRFEDPDDPDDPGGSAGVREPRRPLPLGPMSGAGALPEPTPFVALTLADARA